MSRGETARRLLGLLVALAIALVPTPASADAGSSSPRPTARTTRRGKTAARSHPTPPAKPALSVGNPNEGHLEGGVRLDTTVKYLRIVPAYATGDTRWGLPALVGMIDRAARSVAKKYAGSVLAVGDLSRRGGGDLLRHHSHESGRDVDLGLYAVDARGKQVSSHAFIRFDPSSLAATNAPGATLDLARNWLLIEMLVTDPAARVTHIFVAEPLRQKLLAYGRKHARSRRALDRAASAMLEPVNALPHDDHIHVRIACPRSSGSACVEIAKNAPMGRLAHRAGRGRTARRAPSTSGLSSSRAPRR